jgi:hypothetical protein
MWIEVEDRMINFDHVEWFVPDEEYPKTRVYIKIKHCESSLYHVSYNTLKLRLKAETIVSLKQLVK